MWTVDGLSREKAAASFRGEGEPSTNAPACDRLCVRHDEVRPLLRSARADAIVAGRDRRDVEPVRAGRWGVGPAWAWRRGFAGIDWPRAGEFGRPGRWQPRRGVRPLQGTRLRDRDGYRRSGVRPVLLGARSGWPAGPDQRARRRLGRQIGRTQGP